jgi:pyrimidine operon attenuation protein/uracil phosphoribosyltransferase
MPRDRLRNLGVFQRGAQLLVHHITKDVYTTSNFAFTFHNAVIVSVNNKLVTKRTITAALHNIITRPSVTIQLEESA